MEPLVQAGRSRNLAAKPALVALTFWRFRRGDLAGANAGQATLGHLAKR
jgi:hypothetical protein